MRSNLAVETGNRALAALPFDKPYCGDDMSFCANEEPGLVGCSAIPLAGYSP
jgi:hypothetical protein